MPISMNSTASQATPLNNNQDKWWNVPLSAGIGGCIGGYICYPAEAIKKKLQTKQVIWLTSQPVQKNLYELSRGSTSFAASVTSATVFSMTARHLIQQLPGYDSNSTGWQAASAFGGGAVGAIFGSTPVENIILTQQLNKSGPWGTICKLRSEGIARFWVGLPEIAVREAGFAGIMLWGAGAAKKLVLEKTKNESYSQAAEIAVCVAGAALTQPADTIATRKQEAMNKEGRPLPSLEAIRSIYKDGGVKGFFRGLSGRAVLFTGCALIIPSVEKRVKNFINTGSIFYLQSSPSENASNQINNSRTDKGN